MTALGRLLSFIKPESDAPAVGLWILRIPFTVRDRLRRRLYDGPAALNYPGRRIKGYRSPNLMIYIWLRYWSKKWFTAVGLAVFLLVGAFGFISLISIRMPAYILAASLFCFFILDILIGFIFRPKLDVTRSHTTLVEVGTPISVSHIIRNIGRKTAWDLTVDILPIEQGAFVGGMAEIKSLPQGGQVETTYKVAFKKRGKHILPQPLVGSSFPFGLWQWSAKGHDDVPVYAYAAYSRLDSLNFPLGREGRQGRELFSAAASESNEFMGCREYRYGDNPRLIHAGSWARLQRPVIKEFREEYLPHAALMIDTFRPGPTAWQRFLNQRDMKLEACLMLASAVADRLTADDYLLDVFAPGWDGGTHLTERRGVDQLDATLQLMASVDENNDVPFHGPGREQLTRIEELQNLMVIMMEWDEPRREFIDELNIRRVGTKVVVIADSNNIVDEKLIFLDYRDILAGRVTEL